METIWFLFKKTFSRLFFPVGQILILWVAGAVIWLRWPRRRLGPILMLAAGLLLVFYSLPITGGYLIHRLEARYWNYANPVDLHNEGVKFIVVLSSGMSQGPVTPGDRLSEPSLKRLLEGVRLWQEMPGSKLVLTGGAFFGKLSAGKAMESLAMDLGVPRAAMILETGSWDTDDQARWLAGVIGDHPFALITSAIHMPRSLTIFKSYGLDPIPAPCDFHTKDQRFSLYSFIPQAGGLYVSEMAMYEFLGLIWVKLKNMVWQPQPLTTRS